MPVSSAFLREEKSPGNGSGQEIRSGRRPMGAGLFPGGWCSHRQFLGLYPHQGSIKRSRMRGPRVCHLLPSFFSTMHSECPFVRERSEGGSMDRGRERPNP